MAKPSQPGAQEPPLYIRWTPESCPYALEMRLDLIPRLRAELLLAEEVSRGIGGQEVGGVFIGVFPTPQSPTLRLDDVVFVRGETAAGPDYGLDAAQLLRLSEITAEAQFTDRRVVGLFRTHLRDTPLVPSPADLAMLSEQFRQGLYAFLIISPANPPQGVFFLSIGGVLLEKSASGVFPFEESTFRSLPEVPPEATEDVRNFGLGRIRVQKSIPWLAIASIGLLIFLVCLWTFGGRVSQFLRPTSNQIDLTVMSSGSNLNITWDHAAPLVNSALGATLVILDGSSHRELKLDSDDLRLGHVAYERLTKKVYVVMRLDAPGLHLAPQTFDWTGD